MADFNEYDTPGLTDDDRPADCAYWCEQCCAAYGSDHCPKHDEGPCEVCSAMVAKGQSAVEGAVCCGPCAELAAQSVADLNNSL